MKKENIEKVAETKVESKKVVGEGEGFERIRRITGYLVGTVDRFNDGTGTMERKIKKSFYWYKNVIETNGEEL